ncbi:MAG: penicillin-binding protein activator [Desulfatiglandaceae bacterium]
MTFRAFAWNKAIPLLMGGLAFFLAGCQPRMPIEKDITKEAVTDQFALAEGYLNSGELEKALVAYQTYLDQSPEDKNAPLALHRIAEIYVQTGQDPKALDLLIKISREYPNYRDLPVVEYEIAEGLFRKTDHRASLDQGFAWLEKHPRHPLKPDMLLLLGQNLKALGNNSEAFRWWLKAEAEWLYDLQRQAEISEKLEDLIENSDIIALQEIADLALGTDYAPGVHSRMAAEYLEQGNLDKAREAAMTLVRSTPEPYWVSEGRRILERIEAELSVRKNAVGCLLPLSGPYAIYGQEVLSGIELGMGVFDEADPGPDLELVIKDTKGDPEHAAAELEDLADNEKVIAILGPLSSKAAVPAAKKAQAYNIPIITLTQKEGITEEGTMVFRNFTTPFREVHRLLDIAVSDMHLKRFAILYPENSYGRFLLNLFWDRLETLGGEVTAVESYEPDETDFAEQIKKMTGLYYPRPQSVVEKLREMRTPEAEESTIFSEENEPIVEFDAVFIPDNFQRVAMIAPQLAYYDVVDVLLMGTSLWQSPQLIETAGDYVQGALFSSGFFEGLEVPTVKVFVQAYKTNFDATPGILAATGHDTIKFLKELIARENIRTRRDLHKALFDSYYFNGVTGNISFNFEGEVEKEPLILTISGSRMKLFR